MIQAMTMKPGKCSEKRALVRRRKTAVITGASSGMGRCMARLLSEKIACLEEIWIVARRAERLDALSAELKKCGSRKFAERRIRIFSGDICEEQMQSALRKALALEQPELLFLVNAAGFGKIGSVSELSEETQAKMIALNCEATVHLCWMCLPYMAEKRGRIINFGSAAAFLPQPQFAVYAATKAFVLSFSEALREELRGKKIGVTAVCPGPVRTEFFEIAEELHTAALYKKLLMADAGQVCRKALSDSLKRKPVSVSGISMNAFAVLTRLLPHRFFFFCIRQINRSGGKTGDAEIKNFGA